MTELSTSAEAVLNAVTFTRYDVPYYACPKSIDQIKSDVAAALKALADKVACQIPDDCSADVFNRQLKIRTEILAIAAELRGSNQ